MYIVFWDFEFLKIPVPYRYEEVLSNHYGNWQKYAKGTSLHVNVLFDVNKSYLDIYNKVLLIK